MKRTREKEPVTDVMEWLRVAIADELTIDESEVEPTSTFESLGADSLEAQSIVMTIEEEFGFEFPEDDDYPVTVADWADLIRARRQ